MVFMGSDGQVISNHLEPKETLDLFRLYTRDKKEPETEACSIFNKKTKDGKDMSIVSKLLEEAISSIINVKEERDVESFFSDTKTTFLSGKVSGLDDFELICFLVVI